MASADDKDNETHFSTAQLAVVVNDLSEMKTAIRDMAKAIQQIAVLDARMVGQSTSIDRAFTEIALLHTAIREATVQRENQRNEDRERERVRDEVNWKEHAAFKQLINRAIGAGAVIQCVGGFVLMYSISTISNLVANAHDSEMQMVGVKQALTQHIKEDKLQTEDDLREILRNMKQGAIAP